jgi:hypothetical protein
MKSSFVTKYQGDKDRSHLDPHIVWNQLFFDEAAHETEIRITSRGICNLNLLVTAFDEQLEESSFLLDSHRICQGLISVS